MDAMLRGMSARQLAEWHVFFNTEPWGYEAESALPAGIVASTFANCNRAKDSAPFQPSDFMPFSAPKKVEVLSAEAQAEQIRSLLNAKSV